MLGREEKLVKEAREADLGNNEDSGDEREGCCTAQAKGKAKAKGKGNAAKAKAKAKGKAAKAGGAEVDPAADTDPTEEKPFNKLWAEAGQLRKLMISTLAQSSQLLQMIERTENKWGWAANPQHQGKLESALTALKTKFSEFVVKYHSEKPESVRLFFKKNPQVMRQELERYLGFKPERDGLQQINERLVEKHQVECKMIG